MLAAKNLITHNYYLKAKRKGVKIFLYNEIEFIPPKDNLNNEVFFNCGSQRVESTWYTWEENKKIIDSFKNKFPQFFSIQGYELTLAIEKAMFWSNFKTGYLWYSAKTFYPDQKIYEIDPFQSSKKLYVLIRYFKLKAINIGKVLKLEKNKEKNYQYAIHVKNDFQVGMYQNLIRLAQANPKFKVFVDKKVNKSNLEKFQFKPIEVIQESPNFSPIPNINFSNLKGSDWFVLNSIIIHWLEINNCLKTASEIAHKNLKSALLNEAENGIYGAVVSEVLKSNGATVYNTMNGIKSGESQDAYINFNKWFIWDEKMKQMLMDKNDIQEDKLIVSGHLAEDLVRDYQYKNTLNLDREYLSTKKVISLFSVKGKRYVKLEAIKYFYELLKNDESYFLIIRPHPLERKEDYIIPDPSIKNIHIVQYDSSDLNDTLYDQLLVTDLSVVFGSTVALDSKWMGVLCITFETREKSLVYCVDGKEIIHVKSIQEFQNKIASFSAKKKVKVNNEKPMVSEYIMQVITS